MSTLTTATEMVDLYIQAEKNVLAGQSVSIAGKAFTYANIVEIRAGRQEWEKVVSRLSDNRRGPKVSRVIPLD